MICPLRTIADDVKKKDRKVTLLQLTSQMLLRRPLPSLVIAIEMIGILLMLKLKMEERRLRKKRKKSLLGASLGKSLKTLKTLGRNPKEKRSRPYLFLSLSFYGGSAERLRRPRTP
jgi:hypothetical protein